MMINKYLDGNAIYSGDDDQNPTFWRTSKTYGRADHYDVDKKTEKQLDTWLKDNGFTLNGWEGK
tara:strand:+ start:721 stop:912 length:192 start_codon:yes stop_codon:yes gene_type:complete